MAVQDDQREIAQIELFDLEKPLGEGRSGIDAILRLEDGREVLFELKTTTKTSVTTARDFGEEHIQKWRDKHFLFSKFTKGGKAIEYSIYCGPADIEPWLNEKEEYIRPDYQLSKLAPTKLTLEDLHSVAGKKEIYSLADAKGIQKKQYSKDEYKALMDVANGYSATRMLEILKARCEYVLRRGSTLNNPHIPKGYLDKWDIITANHPKELRKSVENYFKRT